METLLKQSRVPLRTENRSGSQPLLQPRAKKANAFRLFINWCEGQEEKRLQWLAYAIAGHGCFLTPITLFAIIMSGNHFVLWIMAICAMAMSLVTNLAAMPTKITIPVFMFSILIDIVIIAYALVSGLSMSGTYI